MREEHVRARQDALEDLGGALLEHDRRHGPERLAALDRVKHLLRASLARVGEEAAVAQRARPVLRAPLEPADHAAAGHDLGHRAPEVGRPLGLDARAAQLRGHLLVGEGPPERGAGHRRDVVAGPRGQVQRGAQRRPRVARRGLDPDRVERPLVGQARVGDAVERHPAGQRQRALARAVVRPARQVEEHLLQAPLDRAGEVEVLLAPVLAGDARRERFPVDALGREAARPVGPHALAEVREEARLAHGGHGHDLVLVRGAVEAEVLGQLLVEQAE